MPTWINESGATVLREKELIRQGKMNAERELVFPHLHMASANELMDLENDAGLLIIDLKQAEEHTDLEATETELRFLLDLCVVEIELHGWSTMVFGLL